MAAIRLIVCRHYLTFGSQFLPPPLSKRKEARLDWQPFGLRGKRGGLRAFGCPLINFVQTYLNVRDRESV